MNDIVEMDIVLPLARPEREVLEVLKRIRPHWTNTLVDIQVLTGGLVNRIWKVLQPEHPDDIILFKTFGPNTEEYFNRTIEKKIMKKLHKKQLISPLYCIYGNGYAFKYAEGEILTPSDIMDPTVMRLMICMFHKIHTSMEGEQDIPDNILNIRIVNVDRFRKDDHSDLEQNPKYKESLPPTKELLGMCDEMFAIHEDLKREFPVVFVHGDAHMVNVVYNKEQESVTFLDWEVCGVTSEVAEIAPYLFMDAKQQFIAEDIDIMTKEDYMRTFVHLYLKFHPKYQDQTIDDDLLNQWMDGVYRAIYFSALSVVPFALNQMKVNKIGVDYLDLAIMYYRISQQAKAKFQAKSKE